ncbi:MAG: hypothetical protein AB1473_11035 [Thermodesulfobacteriota bacterium]
MNAVKQIHRHAMEFADQAFIAKLQGDLGKAVELTRKAFELECKAAQLVTNDLDLEPTRSVLHRSAASFAMNCGELRQAERLVAQGLAGNPPEDIAEELRDLLDQVHFSRHMSLRGLTLEPEEFQFSMTGDAVGPGIANSNLFLQRYQDVERLVYRTGERVRKEPFREGGPRKKASTGGFDLYVTVPRAASFAVSIRIAVGTNAWLDGMSPGAQLIDELMTCLELFSSSDEVHLNERIPEPAYFRNFVGLARKIAPDGQQVKAVGFTTFREQRERRVLLTKPAAEAMAVPQIAVEEEPEERVVIRGTLKYADALKEEGEIRLLDEKGGIHKVLVPEGMLADIVRPSFDKAVILTGMRRGPIIRLLDIEEAEE